MAAIPLTNPSTAGVQITYTAAAGGGDTIPSSSYLFIQNGSGSSITVTVASAQTCSQGGTHNLAIVVPAAQVYCVGPLGARFQNSSTGLVNLTYSGVTSLGIAAVPAPVV